LRLCSWPPPRRIQMMMMTGEYGYESIQEVSQVSAAIFYTLYLILVFFILVDML
jgi:hypothetical protein